MPDHAVSACRILKSGHEEVNHTHLLNTRKSNAPRLLLPVQTTTRGILCSHGQLLSHQTQVDYIYKNLQHMIDGFSGVLQKI